MCADNVHSVYDNLLDLLPEVDMVNIDGQFNALVMDHRSIMKIVKKRDLSSEILDIKIEDIAPRDSASNYGSISGSRVSSSTSSTGDEVSLSWFVP